MKTLFAKRIINNIFFFLMDVFQLSVLICGEGWDMGYFLNNNYFSQPIL